MGRVQHGYCTACQLVLPSRSFGPAMLQQACHLWRCLQCEEVCSCIHCGGVMALSSFAASEQQKPSKARTCRTCSVEETVFVARNPGMCHRAMSLESLVKATDRDRQVSSPCPRFGAARALATWRLVLARLCDRLPAEAQWSDGSEEVFTKNFP
eukprot:Skav235901  [mRNA]  locus=scaffold256:102425:107273:+ [translate_table: standard]